MHTLIQHEDYIELEPNKAAVGSVIWLHGLGADGNDFLPIVPELGLPESLPLRFIFPHAPLKPVTINNGYVMRAWYDIRSFAIDQKPDVEGILESEKLLQYYIQQERNLDLPQNKILLAGFSQGAVIAMTTALKLSETLAGVLALSGYLPNAATLATQASAMIPKLPFFMGHGTQDEIVPYALGLAAYDQLNRAGFPVAWHTYEMGHSVSEREIRDIGEWVKSIFEK